MLNFGSFLLADVGIGVKLDSIFSITLNCEIHWGKFDKPGCHKDSDFPITQMHLGKTIVISWPDAKKYLKN